MALTSERLRELLSYNPETGEFRWLMTRAHNAKIGDVAGSIDGNGYLLIGVDRRKYRAQRLAWLYMTGVWPKADIDHRDLNRTNNRWGNLREATRSRNNANTPVQANNTSGYKGVSWHKLGRKWQASISVDGKQQGLGLFISPEEAHAAYCKAATEAFGQFARAS